MPLVKQETSKGKARRSKAEQCKIKQGQVKQRKAMNKATQIESNANKQAKYNKRKETHKQNTVSQIRASLKKY